MRAASAFNGLSGRHVSVFEMTKYLRRASFGVVPALLLVAPLSGGSDVTLTGTVSDAACGRDHHGRDAEECVRACVEESGQYALVVGDRVYTLVADDNARARLHELAGHTATVSGDRRSGDVVTVKTVSTPERR